MKRCLVHAVFLRLETNQVSDLGCGERGGFESKGLSEFVVMLGLQLSLIYWIGRLGSRLHYEMSKVLRIRIPNH